MDTRKVFFGVVFLFLLLRIPHYAVSPRWFWDEGINMSYGWNLLEGRSRWSCMEYAWIPHPPLYPLALAFLFRVFGYSIEVARGFSIALNLATLYLLYLIALRVEGRKTALIAAALFSVYPAAIYWGGMAFSNNLLMFWMILSLYFFITHLREGGRNLMLCATSIGLATVTSYTAIFVAIPLAYYILVKERKQFLWGLAFLFLPATFLFTFILSTKSGVFLFDLATLLDRFQLSRRQLHISIPLLFLLSYIFYKKRREVALFSSKVLESESRKIFNVEWCFFKTEWAPLILLTIHTLLAVTLFVPITGDMLLGGGDYFWLGIIGLLFLDSYFMNTVVLIYFLPVFTQIILIGRTDHMLIPIYPFFCLGVAVFLNKFYGYMKKTKVLNNFLAKRHIIFTLLILPFMVLTINDFYSFIVNPNPIGSEDVEGVKAVAGYVNKARVSGQPILATSHLTRFIEDPVCVIPQGFAYEGYKIEYYPSNLPKQRFFVNCSYKNTRYLVSRRGTLNWLKLLNYTGINEWVGGYEKVFESGGYIVYRHDLG